MAQVGTVVTYGPVTFSNVLTRRFRQEPVFDSGGQNVQYTRFSVHIVGHVHAIAATKGSQIESTYTDPMNLPDGRASASHKWIRWNLMQPRQQFVFISSNDTLLQAGPASGAVPAPPPSSTQYNQIDLNNGPRCLGFEIVQIIRNNVFRVEAEFEICLTECNNSLQNTNTSSVLSHCWSCTDDIDRNFYTRRTFSGTLRMATALLNPHSFRNVVLPPVQPGMRRDSMQFVAADDGVTLQYTITDQEVAFAPPKPATSWRLSHTESINREESSIGSYVSVDVTLAGDRDTDKNELIALAAAIIDAKVTGQAPRRSRIFLNYSITNETGDDGSTIHASARARRTHRKQEPAIAGVAIERLKPLNAGDLIAVAGIVGQYDPTLSRGARPGENLESHGPISLIAAFSTYLQSACGNQHELFRTPLAGEPGTAVAGPTVQVEAYTTDDLPGDTSVDWTTQDASDNVYTYYAVDSTYERAGMKIQLPIAQGSQSTGSLGGGTTGATSAFVSLAATQTQRVVRMEAERVGAPPSLPAPAEYWQENGINYYLLDSKIQVGAPERGPDGEYVFRERREYVYGTDYDPLQPNGNSQLRIGTNVNDSAGVYARVFNPAEWTAAP